MASDPDRSEPDRRNFQPAFPSTLTGVAAFVAARRQVALLVGVGLTAVVGTLDVLTDPDLSFSIFYLVPVSLVAWSTTSGLAVALSALAAVTWLLADAVAGGTYSSPLIPAWNSVSRFAVFAAFALVVARLRRSLDHERTLARTDALTGVRNVRSFHERAAATMRHNQGAQVMFVYFDLDDFKDINDRLGHRGGDAVLRVVGDALRASVRDHDVIGRLGGDEFAILSLFGRDSDAERHAASMLVRIALVLSDLDPPVSFSAGAVWTDDPSVPLDVVIDAADDLMYEVKARGKGTFECKELALVGS